MLRDKGARDAEGAFPAHWQWGSAKKKQQDLAMYCANIQHSGARFVRDTALDYKPGGAPRQSRTLLHGIPEVPFAHSATTPSRASTPVIGGATGIQPSDQSFNAPSGASTPVMGRATGLQPAYQVGQGQGHYLHSEIVHLNAPQVKRWPAVHVHLRR